MEDKNIVQMYWDRNERAISETSIKYGNYCTSIAMNILKNYEDAQECVNNTYLNTWNTIPPHKPNILSAFLGKITRNLSFNRYKYNHSMKRGGYEISLILDELGEIVSDKETVEDNVIKNELIKTIDNFLNKLPDEGISPEELILDDEAISYMTSIEYENSKYVTVNLSVPKFDVSSSIDLKDGLQKLGITDMFDSSKSDFSPLSENAKGIMISKAEQDTRVIIDEEGCKASSLTIMAYDGAGMPEDYIDFILDRPFIFEIISESGLPLFVGIVNNPAVN